MTRSLALSPSDARRLWLRAQRLDQAAPFGSGPEATRRAIEHLGYVQIDTINVIERSHHHILHSRIPDYARDHLVGAQSREKSVFEYWTHALAYVPVRDFPFFIAAMREHRANPSGWFGPVSRPELRAILARVEREGALSIRDIGDDVLVDKTHPWASRKPSKRALQQAFFSGDLTVSARAGMLKTYELTDRHFGWNTWPRAASAAQITAYRLDRALLAQGLVSLDSAAYLDPGSKPALRALIERRVARRQLLPVHIEGAEAVAHWITPEALDTAPQEAPTLTHILSPFDPLIIQRKRLKLFFGYEHLFEAYLPAPKRRLGYFTLPVLMGDRIVAGLDLKADRTTGTLLIRQRTDFVALTSAEEAALDEALDRFARFQFASGEGAPSSMADAGGEPS